MEFEPADTYEGLLLQVESLVKLLNTKDVQIECYQLQVSQLERQIDHLRQRLARLTLCVPDNKLISSQS